MKNIFRTAFVFTALALTLMLCIAAIAETVEPETPELPAIEDAQPAAGDDAAQAPQDNTAAADTSALQDALNAYRSAKQAKQADDLESELNDYVASGKLTQEQADLILNYYKEQAALKNGTCPNCGYQFSNGNGFGRGGRGGKGGMRGKGGRGMRGGYGMQSGTNAQSGSTQDGASANGTAYEDSWAIMPNISSLEGI